MNAESQIYTKQKCTAYAKKQLELAKRFRIEGDMVMSVYCLNRAADWRRHAVTIKYNH